MLEKFAAIFIDSTRPDFVVWCRLRSAREQLAPSLFVVDVDLIPHYTLSIINCSNGCRQIAWTRKVVRNTPSELTAIASSVQRRARMCFCLFILCNSDCNYRQRYTFIQLTGIANFLISFHCAHNDVDDEDEDHDDISLEHQMILGSALAT